MGYFPLALCGLALAICISPAFAADAVPAGAEVSNVTPFVNTDGEIRVLPRTRPDRLYQLHIGLPTSYGKEPNRKYPAIYVTDGYWHYAVIRSIYWGLTFDNTLPESIVVGIGYAGENLDYGKRRGSLPTASYEHALRPHTNSWRG